MIVASAVFEDTTTWDDDRDMFVDELEWEDLLDVTVDDVAYVTDRYLAIRRDQLVHLPALERRPGPKVDEWPPPPEQRPGPPPSLPRVWLLDKLERAALTVHDSDHAKIMHVYRGDTHVGYVTRPEGDPRPCDTWEALPAVRRIAARHNVTVLMAGNIVESVLAEEWPT